MANKDGHRRFGNVRKRESGRYQVRYPGPDGRTRTAPQTFATKTEAERALTLIEAQILSGNWTDPERAKVKLGAYAALWLEQCQGPRPRTRELYAWLLRKHIDPHLGKVSLDKLSTPIIRAWLTPSLRPGLGRLHGPRHTACSGPCL